MSKTKSELSELLIQGPRTDLSKEFSKASGVALLLFADPAMSGKDLELLFIQRALNPLDNWSGQIAFPGGKKDLSDATLLDACLREVQEEIGLVLVEDDLMGSLDDLQARKKGHLLQFYVQPFVFLLEGRPEIFKCDSEVADVFWVPVAHLVDSANRTHYVLAREGMELSLPAIRLPRGEILWGLSYMMVMNLLRKLKLD